MIILLYACAAMTACGSATSKLSPPTLQYGPVRAVSTAVAEASGPFAGTMSVQRVVCDAAPAASALTVVITGVAGGHLLELTLYIQPEKGAGTYNLTKGAGQSAVSIANLTPTGGIWAVGTEESSAKLTTASGSQGSFDVWGDRAGYAPVEIAGSWNCVSVAQH